MNTKHPEATLYLVRHGETEWNVREVIQGHRDSPLTDKGLGQARSLAREFQGIDFDAVYASDLHRARRTAEIIAVEKKLAVTTRELLRERTFGSYDGIPMQEYRKKLRHLLTEYDSLEGRDKWSFKIAPDIESDEELSGRFITILREIAAGHPGNNVLVVTHGGCIRTFLMHTGYVPIGNLPSGSIGNTAYVKVRSDGTDFTILETRGIRLPERSKSQNPKRTR